MKSALDFSPERFPLEKQQKCQKNNRGPEADGRWDDNTNRTCQNQDKTDNSQNTVDDKVQNIILCIESACFCNDRHGEQGTGAKNGEHKIQ